MLEKEYFENWINFVGWFFAKLSNRRGHEINNILKTEQIL